MSSLAKYRKMRDFERTREPRGAAKAAKKLARPAAGLSFVVQKHDARNLHYDFRLELDGVLLSWAVPKGPSLDPSVKRLAMEVEPHPLEYGGFEGTIPKGEYGGGTVMLWDRGTWTPEGDPHVALAKGHLTFSLQGEKLKGAWHLVRTRRIANGAGKDAKAGKGWLLFKSRDAEARADDGDRLLEEASESVLSGHDLGQIAAANQELPDVPAPELATLVDAAPSGDDFLHEIKLDGYRILARVGAGDATLHTRSGKDWTSRMPTLHAALKATGMDGAILDGELVKLDEHGVSNFQALQNSLTEGRENELVYFVFDLLHEGSQDLRPLPLVERKSRLRSLLARHAEELGGTVRFSAHVVGSGPEFFENACKLKLEGTIAKRVLSPYHSGRGRDWLKIKCTQRQEFTIVGFTAPGGSRSHFGALLVGTKKGGKLEYAGKVGTGFSEASLKELHAKLKPLSVKQPPVVKPPRGADARGVTWVKPLLVAEIGFTELTQDGLLRHPTFQGLREDKPAREVKLETARRIETGPAHRYPITHPDKVLYPEQGITKRELLDYYALVAERMLPHVANRPLTLVRCPNGQGKPCFFQKHPGAASLPGLRSVSIREKEGKSPYSVLDDATGLFGLVQLGALEIHTWGSRADDFEHPDILVFDLDPDPSVGYEAVITGARTLRRVFDDAKLESFVKTTGGKGLHVCVPICPELDWEQAKDFTHRIAQAIAQNAPELYVATQSKAKRQGKTFIDYLRNARGATFIAPYSTRARANAPLAVPLEWDELSPTLPPDHFTLRNIETRLSRLARDPFERLTQLKPRLSAGANRVLPSSGPT
jgi:bifunctional non-homologous end joining protein LigD